MTEYLNPHDAELEEVILGACLLETTAMTLVADTLRPEMFYEEANREVYAALQGMHRTGKSIDLITVKNELNALGKLDMVGGPYRLTQLISRVLATTHLEFHATILREKYVRREGILGLHRQLAAFADESVDLYDAIAGLHQLIDHLEGTAVVNDCLRDMDRLMQDTLEQVKARVENNVDGVTGVPTGLKDLDKLTAGLQPSDLVVIAARPSVGKTAFALHIALSAGRAGKHVVVFSLEMPGERLGDRCITAQAADVNPSHLRTGRLTDEEQRQTLAAAADLARLPIHVDDNPKTSMDHIRSSARLLKAKGRCDCLIIDYLQLCDMKTDQRNRNREQEVAEASRKAKLMAKEMNIPVVLLCQLNRDCETRADHRPALSDLRESGAIEQDADVVMLLYRPEVYNIPTERRSKYPSERLGMVMVVKQRNGETGDVYFGHNGSMTQIGEYVPPLQWMMNNAK